MAVGANIRKYRERIRVESKARGLRSTASVRSANLTRTPQNTVVRVILLYKTAPQDLMDVL